MLQPAAAAAREKMAEGKLIRRRVRRPPIKTALSQLIDLKVQNPLSPKPFPRVFIADLSSKRHFRLSLAQIVRRLIYELAILFAPPVYSPLSTQTQLKCWRSNR